MKAGYKPDLVTVIIPTYNRSSFVVEAMESVFRQDYRPIELIVVDDGSKDNTEQVIHKWIETNADDNELQANYFRQEHKGAPAARNLGLIESNGEFIQFLDSDCELLPEKIAVQFQTLNSRYSISHCYCVTEFINSEGERISLLGQPCADNIFYNAVMPGFTSIAPLWRRSALYEAGPWDEGLTTHQDWVYKVGILLRAGPGPFIPKALCRAKIHDGERISKHGTEAFAIGTQEAIRKVGALLSDTNSDIKLAKNHLSRRMLAVFKVFLRMKAFSKAQEVLSEAATFASGKVLLQLAMIKLLFTTLSPTVFRLLLSCLKRI